MTDSTNQAEPTSRPAQEDRSLVIHHEEGRLILALDVAYWMAKGRAGISRLASTKAASQPESAKEVSQPDGQPVEAAEEPGRQLPPPS